MISQLLDQFIYRQRFFLHRVWWNVFVGLFTRHHEHY